MQKYNDTGILGGYRDHIADKKGLGRIIAWCIVIPPSRIQGKCSWRIHKI